MIRSHVGLQEIVLLIIQNAKLGFKFVPEGHAPVVNMKVNTSLVIDILSSFLTKVLAKFVWLWNFSIFLKYV